MLLCNRRDLDASFSCLHRVVRSVQNGFHATWRTTRAKTSRLSAGVNLRASAHDLRKAFRFVQILEIAPELSGKSGRFRDFGKSISRLHGKVSVIDDDRLFIGSMNLDGRSSEVHTEMGLVIDSPELVADFTRLFAGQRPKLAYRLRLSSDGSHVQWLEYDANGNDIVHDSEPGGHVWLRLRNWLL